MIVPPPVHFSICRRRAFLLLLVLVVALGAVKASEEEQDSHDGSGDSWDEDGNAETDHFEGGGGGGEEEGKIKVSFINVSRQPIQLSWVHVETNEDVPVLTLTPYDETEMGTFVGHVMSYMYGGVRYTVPIDERGGGVVYVVGPESVQVQCSTTTGIIHAMIQPHWSPRGASHFLDLIDNHRYYDGCALNRVVKGFLIQFGIGADYDLRTEFRSRTILDDSPLQGMEFEPGFLSYAGSGPHSRTTEVFVVAPDTPENQLTHFGTNPWETPFGYVQPNDLSTVVDQWESSYGDMPPWGSGPDPQKIYEEDGYDVYLKEEFPKMSYIKECHIVPQGDNDPPNSDEL